MVLTLNSYCPCDNDRGGFTIALKMYHVKNVRSSDTRNKDPMLEEYMAIERESILGGAAVEDNLQQQVPQCVYSFSQAGVKIWVMTGSYNVYYKHHRVSCSLLLEELQQICISTN